MTALVAVLLLLAGEAGTAEPPDGGVRSSPSRTAEDEEVIRNLDLLEQLANSEALEMVLDLEVSPSSSDR